MALLLFLASSVQPSSRNAIIRAGFSRLLPAPVVGDSDFFALSDERRAETRRHCLRTSDVGLRARILLFPMHRFENKGSDDHDRGPAGDDGDGQLGEM